MPEMEFFFLLMPLDKQQAARLGTDGLEQVQHRVVRSLQKEISAAIIDQEGWDDNAA